MITLDLQDAFNLVPVHKNYRKYLRFEFQNKFYKFTCIPFGLCTAPLIFTKFMRPVVASLRKLRFLSVVYLDDFLLIENIYSNCLENFNVTKEFLKRLGLSLPDSKRKSMLEKLVKFEKLINLKIRDFAAFVGTLTSACPALAYNWLYVEKFESQKYLALSNIGKNYKAKINLKPNKNDFL